jgi:hypothetical protein
MGRMKDIEMNLDEALEQAIEITSQMELHRNSTAFANIFATKILESFQRNSFHFISLEEIEPCISGSHSVRNTTLKALQRKMVDQGYSL